MEILTAEQQKILAWLTDEESRHIFRSLLKYYKTDDPAVLGSFCFSLYRDKTGVDLETLLRAHEQPLVVFGAGGCGWQLNRMLAPLGVFIDAYADNNTKKQNRIFCEKPVIHPQQILKNYEQPLILISSSSSADYGPMSQQLRTYGIPQENIFVPGSALGTQYFDCPDFRLGDSEIFVDAGSLNGGDCQMLAKLCNGKYKKLLAFEPDAANIALCREVLADYTRCTVYPLGLWDSRQTLSFNSASGCSGIASDGTEQIEVDALDNVLDGETCTFIKMDIEGAELQALHGAEKTIRTHRPKLAICVYHRQEDLTRIPLYLKVLVPEYRLTLRHYGLGAVETVLYAY